MNTQTKMAVVTIHVETELRSSINNQNIEREHKHLQTLMRTERQNMLTDT